MSASLLILLATVIASVLAFNNVSYYERWIFKPYDVYRGRKIETLLTSGFIHADWVHLLVNMFTFYNFAFALERTIGMPSFLVVYLGSLILCEVGTIYKYKDNYYYRSLGASGAVCGVLFSYILFYPMNSLIIFPIPLPIPAFVFAFVYLAYSVYASKRGQDHINHDAHFWGAIGGAVITLILKPDALGRFLSAF